MSKQISVFSNQYFEAENITEEELIFLEDEASQDERILTKHGWLIPPRLFVKYMRHYIESNIKKKEKV